MTEMIRCPACRGAKKVPKLGGMIGECNSCGGKGQILATDKIVMLDSIVTEDVISKELINAVSDSVPTSIVEDIPNQFQAKIDIKKALYKRKIAK